MFGIGIKVPWCPCFLGYHRFSYCICLILCAFKFILFGANGRVECLNCSFFQSRWYHPENHVQYLSNYMTSMRVAKQYSCLDLFGASERVAKGFSEAGYLSISYDIKLSPAYDICSEAGFQRLLRIGMMSLDCSD